MILWEGYAGGGVKWMVLRRKMMLYFACLEQCCRILNHSGLIYCTFRVHFYVLYLRICFCNIVCQWDEWVGGGGRRCWNPLDNLLGGGANARRSIHGCTLTIICLVAFKTLVFFPGLFDNNLLARNKIEVMIPFKMRNFWFN